MWWGLAWLSVNMWFSVGFSWHGNLPQWHLVAPPVHAAIVAVVATIAIIAVEVSPKATWEHKDRGEVKSVRDGLTYS